MAPDQDRSAPAGNLIREYLLGRLDDQEELEKGLSEEILNNDDFAEIVAATEDEIIEDYLDGTLSGPDREAVDKYFLRPSERRQKLFFARLLRQRFQKDESGRADLKTETGAGLGLASARGGDSHSGLMFHFRSHVRTYSEIAALLILSASTFIYMAKVRQGMNSEIEVERKNQQLVESQLAQERNVTASLLQEFRPMIVPVSFVLSAERGPSASKRIEINPSIQRIHVEFDLQKAPVATYDVQLISDSQTLVWSETGLYSSSGILSFQVPVQGITTGDYHLTVISQPNNVNKGSYYFHAEVAK